MTGVLSEVLNLIEKERYQEAEPLLSTYPQNHDVLFMRSLLCRLTDSYIQEIDVVNTGLKQYSSSEYMRKRKDWLMKPFFEKMVARPAVKSDTKNEPLQSTMRDLCIATAGDSDKTYFRMLIELLESLKNTQNYKDVPIFIIDCGLTARDKSYLLGRFNNIKEIKSIGFDIDCQFYDFRLDGWHEKRSVWKSMLGRIFLPSHFGGYRFYMWLDTDLWVQDESSLDRIVKNAETQEFGVVADVHNDTFNPSNYWIQRACKYRILPMNYFSKIQDKTVIASDIFCIDSKSKFFQKWAKFTKQTIDEMKYYFLGNNELTFNYTFYKSCKDKEVLDASHNYSPVKNGLPVHQGNVLYMPNNVEQPVGIVNLAKIKYLKENHIFNCVKKSAVSSMNLAQAKREFNEVVQTNMSPLHVMKSKKPHQDSTSMHFLGWPWQDKAAVKEALRKKLDQLLSV